MPPLINEMKKLIWLENVVIYNDFSLYVSYKFSLKKYERSDL